MHAQRSNSALSKKKHIKPSLKSNAFLCDKDCSFYCEQYFNDMLSLERKRAERSKKCFLLMLLKIEKLFDYMDSKTAIKSMEKVLFSETRETDLKGWYRKGSTLGIIYTEVNGIDGDFLKQKICDGLCSTFDPEIVKTIDIDLYMFPEDDSSNSSGMVDQKMYPEITKMGITKKTQHFIKRFIDILGSISAIILFAPVFMLVPICIKMTSKGPVIFRQERIGQFGKPFTFLKFRSMYVTNDERLHQDYIKRYISSSQSDQQVNGTEQNGNVYKITDDPRVTPIGKFLRKTSLDEFPQFFNVLRGDMSLVGPRPPIPYEIEDYDLWHKKRVIEIKPGITGLWQVEGRSSTTFDDMVRLDLKYIREWSLLLDIKILLKTPWVVLTCKGAY